MTTETTTAPAERLDATFLDCPAYLDHAGTVRCGLPAEVRCRFTMRSTDGPLESAMIRCPAGHYFSGSIESLTRDSADQHGPGTAGARSRDGAGGLAPRVRPAEPEPSMSRPNTAPAYYLGRPARLWITAIRAVPASSGEPADIQH